MNYGDKQQQSTYQQQHESCRSDRHHNNTVRAEDMTTTSRGCEGSQSEGYTHSGHCDPVLYKLMKVSTMAESEAIKKILIVS